MEHFGKLPKNLIINDIFKYLTISDILSLRLINKQSKHILNEMLETLQRNYEQFIASDEIFDISEDFRHRIIEEYDSVKSGIDHISNYSLNEIMAFSCPPLIVVQGAELTYKIIHQTTNKPEWRAIVKWLLRKHNTRNQFKCYNLERMPDELYQSCNADIDLDKLSKISVAIYQITLWGRAVLFINHCLRADLDTRKFVENLKLRTQIQRDIRALRRIILN